MTDPAYKIQFKALNDRFDRDQKIIAKLKDALDLIMSGTRFPAAEAERALKDAEEMENE